MGTGRQPVVKPDATSRVPGWWRSATRWTQVTLAEDDPAHFDAEFWLNVMRDTQSNAACISAGGYIAYYPTRIPLHYRSKHLGETDPFGTLVDGARGLGMHVMARVDPHAVHADAAKAHPEWLACNAEGEPLAHWAIPDIWLTCPFSTYHRDFVTEVAREIVREYDVDAIFANRWSGHGGISYSEAARRSFRDETGYHLPQREEDLADPAWHAYVAWRKRKLSELVRVWDSAVKDIRPHAVFIPNLGSMMASDLDHEVIEKHYPFFVIDKQGRSGTEVPWAAGRHAKRNRGIFLDRPVVVLASVGPEHHQHRWKDAVAPGEEVKTWVADAFAQGARPWFTKFNATIADPRWVRPIVEVFGLHARLEPILSPMQPTAEVAVLDVTRTVPSRSISGDRILGHDDGFYQALVEARVPFELVSDTVVSAERLSKFKVLVLPNADSLSDAQCAVIREYVASGGSLVADYQTSLLDERGQPRANFGLADVFGVRLTAPARYVKNNYIALTGEHAVNAGFGAAKRIIGGTQVLGVEAEDDTEVPFRFVPDFPDLPMEEVYARAEPDLPAVVCRQVPGGGRIVYCAFDLGAVFWEAMQSDHGRLVANAVRWAHGRQAAVTVDGAGLVDVAVRRAARSVAVTLVNLTNPMAMRGAIRETIPLPPQTVSVALPSDVDDLRARLLVGEVDAPVRIADGRAVVDVPTAGILEVVHVSWEPARGGAA